MEIEHTTVKGNTTVRNSSEIALQTIKLLKDFKIREGKRVLNFPKTNFQVKITASYHEGALFDIKKADDIIFTNVCCLEPSQKEGLLKYTRELAENHPLISQHIIREPKKNLFLYSIPVNPFAANSQELITIGEIEFYIYYMLYLARNK